MRLWLRYLHEKRYTIILYFATVFFFIVVGTLYHLENLGKLFYAAVLTFTVWGAAGVWGGLHYVRRSRQLESVAKHFEQSGELFLSEERQPGETEGGIAEAENREEVYLKLLSLVYERMESERKGWEERTAECRDYYVMWTHQIKTPISALKLLLENNRTNSRDDFLMREELFKIQQYAEMALTFQRLESISSDLLFQEYDLNTVLKNTVRKYGVLFINKGLSLELQETDVKVITDEKWLSFCIGQLLSNSIKYTPSGKIMIRAQAPESAKDGAELVIEDTGIGIRPEDLPRIFERGFTGYNGRLDKKATGIGLYLCRTIFKHLGIKMRVESEEDKGTKVTIIFPHEERLQNF